MKITLQIDELKALLKSAGPGAKTAALDTLLNWSKPVSAEPCEPESALAQVFGFKPSENFPIAGFTALTDGLVDAGNYTSGHWIRADPVCLQATMTQVFLAASGSPELATQQRKELEDLLNQHFEADGLQFLLPNNQRWYISLDSQHADATGKLLPSPRVLLGEDISTATSSMDKFWQSCFNEIQMLLFASPLKTHREAMGLAPISGLWLWGGGQLQTQAETNPELYCSGNSALLRGCANFSGAIWHENIVSSDTDRLLIHWSGETSGTAIEQLELLEQQVFIPLVEKLQNGAELELIAADAGQWQIRQRKHWPWHKALSARSVLLDAKK